MSLGLSGCVPGLLSLGQFLWKSQWLIDRKSEIEQDKPILVGDCHHPSIAKPEVHTSIGHHFSGPAQGLMARFIVIVQDKAGGVYDRSAIHYMEEIPRHILAPLYKAGARYVSLSQQARANAEMP